MDIPDTLIDLQRAADAEWARLAELTDNDERAAGARVVRRWRPGPGRRHRVGA
ncbi:hypothetical protein [Streptomyces albidoflavus]|uniref:hypothetical protein n=1 Tax=Streptomyces albidoflavus TaxID=1886 RepID=UPI0013EE507C|nr:hypothetical protein [Streptomyces albidoflavus]